MPITISDSFILRDSILENKNSINQTTFLLRNLERENIIEALNVNNSNQDEFYEIFTYYMWLLRDESYMLSLMNSEEFPTSYIIKYIFSSMGRWIGQGNDIDDFFYLVGTQFSSQKSLEILISEKVELFDISLALILICNLKSKDLNIFLYKIHDIHYIANFFLEVFDQLEEERVKFLFVKNPALFANLVAIVKECMENSKNRELFLSFTMKFRNEIEMVENLISAAHLIHFNFDIMTERSKSLFERDMKRIIQIVELLEDTRNLTEKIDLLLSESVIIDADEKGLIESILKNPNILRLI
jgi:hypothetical protein